MQLAIEQFSNVSQAIAMTRSTINDQTPWGTRRAFNDRLMLTERAFLGSPVESGQEWYLHVIFAPSGYNSYGGVTFPAIYNAIAKQDYVLAEFLVMRIAQIIYGAADFLNGGLLQ